LPVRDAKSNAEFQIWRGFEMPPDPPETAGAGESGNQARAMNQDLASPEKGQAACFRCGETFKLVSVRFLT
jgi:hypothetical protein